MAVVMNRSMEGCQHKCLWPVSSSTILLQYFLSFMPISHFPFPYILHLGSEMDNTVIIKSL